MIRFNSSGHPYGGCFALWFPLFERSSLPSLDFDPCGANTFDNAMSELAAAAIDTASSATIFEHVILNSSFIDPNDFWKFVALGHRNCL